MHRASWYSRCRRREPVRQQERWRPGKPGAGTVNQGRRLGAGSWLQRPGRPPRAAGAGLLRRHPSLERRGTKRGLCSYRTGCPRFISGFQCNSRRHPAVTACHSTPSLIAPQPGPMAHWHPTSVTWQPPCTYSERVAPSRVATHPLASAAPSHEGRSPPHCTSDCTAPPPQRQPAAFRGSAGAGGGGGAAAGRGCVPRAGGAAGQLVWRLHAGGSSVLALPVAPWSTAHSAHMGIPPAAWSTWRLPRRQLPPDPSNSHQSQPAVIAGHRGKHAYPGGVGGRDGAGGGAGPGNRHPLRLQDGRVPVSSPSVCCFAAFLH